MTQPTLQKSIILPAPREVVWAFLTEKDKLAQWFHPAEADLLDKQDFALIKKEDDGAVTKIFWGTVVEMDAPARLVYEVSMKPLNGNMTNVSWELEDVLGGTKLSLVHKGVGKAAGDAAMGMLLALDAGWDRHLLSLRTEIND